MEYDGLFFTDSLHFLPTGLNVLHDESSSDTVPVSLDAPQGAVLDPLLFLLYIYNFPPSTHNSSTRLFADDSLLLRAVKAPDDCRLLHKDLDPL